MRRSAAVLLGVVGAAVLAAGCARVAVRAGFDDVQRQVAERTGHEVCWDLGTADDEAVRAALDKLLAAKLTPEGAVQVALLNNRRLQAVYEQLGIAQADLVQARLLKNPVFDVSVRFVHHGGTQFEPVVVDDFIHILLMPLRKRLAEAELEWMKLMVTGAVMDLAAEVRVALLSYQADRQMLEMQRTQLDAAEASYEMAGRLQEATTVLVQVGEVKVIELLANNPGDWIMHCHMTHHMMNQMGHNVPNLVGAHTDGVDEKIERLVPGYMTMGTIGMMDMTKMGMPLPENSIPMLGASFQFGDSMMGGMATVFKVREGITSYEDPGWYRFPAGSMARAATDEELAADDIAPG